MQRRNSPQPKKNESGQQRRTEFENAEPSKVNHKPENPGKRSPFRGSEPGGVNLHHARRAKSLKVAIDAANQDEKPKQRPERRQPKENIHDDRPGGADQHRSLAAK